jgi:hypothetical protein
VESPGVAGEEEEEVVVAAEEAGVERYFGAKIPAQLEKALLLPGKLEDLRINNLCNILSHIAHGSPLRSLPTPHETWLSGGGEGGGGGGRAGGGAAVEEVEGEVVREGARDALAAARGEHLCKLFSVVMPDGRTRADWNSAMGQLLVALNMTDVKRRFQSNRRFDRYGRPKESLFTPHEYTEALSPSELPGREVREWLSSLHLIRMAERGGDYASSDETEESESETEAQTPTQTQAGAQIRAERGSWTSCCDATRPDSNAAPQVPALLAKGGTVLVPMDMETMQGKADRGEYHVVEALEYDVMLLVMNALLQEMSARNKIKAICNPFTGQRPETLPPVMPCSVATKRTACVGMGTKATAMISLTWLACNHLGHLTRAETAAVTAAKIAATAATARTAASAAVSRSSAAERTALVSRASAATRGETAATRGETAATRGDTAKMAEMRPVSRVEYQV